MLQAPLSTGCPREHRQTHALARCHEQGSDRPCDANFARCGHGYHNTQCHFCPPTIALLVLSTLPWPRLRSRVLTRARAVKQETREAPCQRQRLTTTSCPRRCRQRERRTHRHDSSRRLVQGRRRCSPGRDQATQEGRLQPAAHLRERYRDVHQGKLRTAAILLDVGQAARRVQDASGRVRRRDLNHFRRLLNAKCPRVRSRSPRSNVCDECIIHSETGKTAAAFENQANHIARAMGMRLDYQKDLQSCCEDR